MTIGIALGWGRFILGEAYLCNFVVQWPACFIRRYRRLSQIGAGVLPQRHRGRRGELEKHDGRRLREGFVARDGQSLPLAAEEVAFLLGILCLGRWHPGCFVSFKRCRKTPLRN